MVFFFKWFFTIQVHELSYFWKDFKAIQRLESYVNTQNILTFEMMLGSGLLFSIIDYNKT